MCTRCTMRCTIVSFRLYNCFVFTVTVTATVSALEIGKNMQQLLALPRAAGQTHRTTIRQHEFLHSGSHGVVR